MLLWLTLIAGPAFAEDPSSHLPTMQKQHGWQTVAAVVKSSDQGDMSLSDVHERLQELGLQTLTMPIRSEVTGLTVTGPLHGCGWNQGVHCAVEISAGATLEFGAVCATARGPVPEVVLTATSGAPMILSEAGTGHISDLLPCWAAGGDRVVLVPAATTSAGLDLTSEGLAAANVQNALAGSAPGIVSCGPGIAVIETDDAGRLTVLKVERDAELSRPATECIQDVLKHLRLDGAAKVRITLPVPAPPAGPSIRDVPIP
ncbi:MAG: hypothetical protein AB8H79_07655 [Myxococcota bacterium]